MNDLFDILGKLWPALIILALAAISLILPDKHVKEFDPQPEPPGKKVKEPAPKRVKKVK